MEIQLEHNSNEQVVRTGDEAANETPVQGHRHHGIGDEYYEQGMPQGERLEQHEFMVDADLYRGDMWVVGIGYRHGVSVRGVGSL